MWGKVGGERVLGGRASEKATELVASAPPGSAVVGCGRGVAERPSRSRFGEAVDVAPPPHSHEKSGYVFITANLIKS